MNQIDVIRISIQLLETNGPHAILALPAKKRELERARRMKQIDSQIAELKASIDKSENTINGYQHRLPHLKKMLQNLEAVERRESIILAP